MIFPYILARILQVWGEPKHHLMKNPIAHIQLLVGNLIWACGYPIYNYMMPGHIKPLPLFTLTTIVTALLSLTSLLSRTPETRRVERQDILAILGAGILIALLRKGMLLFGLSMTSPIDGSIISTITPVVVLIFSVILGAESFSRRKALGIILGFGGAIGVILSGSNTDAGGDARVLGNILVLLCAFISAIYMLWFKKLLVKYDPLTLLRWIFCIAAIITIPIGFDSVTEVNFSQFNTPEWFALCYLVIMPTYIPNVLLTSALKRVPPTVASIYTYIQPTVAVIISISIGLDKLHIMTALFAALIFAGVGIVITSSNKLTHVSNCPARTAAGH